MAVLVEKDIEMERFWEVLWDQEIFRRRVEWMRGLHFIPFNAVVKSEKARVRSPRYLLSQLTTHENMDHLVCELYQSAVKEVDKRGAVCVEVESQGLQRSSFLVPLCFKRGYLAAIATFHFSK